MTALAFPKPQRIELPAYLKFVRNHPCVVPKCWRNWIHASHIIFDGQGKVGSKVDDTQAVPQCERHHMELHRIGRAEFEEKYSLDFAQIIIRLLTEYMLTLSD